MSAHKGKLSRHAERKLAFQVLYGISFTADTTYEDVCAAYQQSPGNTMDADINDDGNAPDALPAGFAWDLVLGTWKYRNDIDQIINAHSRKWRVDRMGRIEVTLLRMAIFEMLYIQNVPCRVTINEALEIDKQFGEESASSFVNGILDAVAKAIESGELKKHD